jgi:3-methylfumaryl-CoA hydratase
LTTCAWVGHTESAEDVVAPSKVAALAATLDRDDAWPIGGRSAAAALALDAVPAGGAPVGDRPDGHPARGGFLPPVPLPRRLWAGGRLSFPQALRVGERVERRSRVMSVEHKSGRSGDLVFVMVRHEFHGPAGLCVTEEHDIVYRDLPAADAAPPACQPAPAGAAWERKIVPDDVLLFRYSALSFNGHRIHYDRRYVTEVEGYPGLIVHGPLIATLLVDLLRRNLPGATIAAFAFRALKPVFDIAPFFVCGRPEADGRAVRLWARDSENDLAMDMQVTLA